MTQRYFSAKEAPCSTYTKFSIPFKLDMLIIVNSEKMNGEWWVRGLEPKISLSFSRKYLFMKANKSAMQVSTEESVKPLEAQIK